MAKRKSAARTVDTAAQRSDAASVYEVRHAEASTATNAIPYAHSLWMLCVSIAQDASGTPWTFMLNYTDISYGSYGYARSIACLLL